MNFDLTSTDWTQVTDLSNNKTYLLQSRSIAGNYCKEVPIFFIQNATIPTDNKTGVYISTIEFKNVNSLNVYIRGEKGLNIEILEVQQ